MAKSIFDHTQQALADYAKRDDVAYPLSSSVRLRRVRVTETSSSWAEYEAS